MQTIGIRELKAQLSRVLREVQKGELVLITDRGRVVAELRSPDATYWNASPEDRAMARLAAQGHLRVAERSVVSPYQISPVSAPAGTARQLIDEDREDK